MAVFKPAFVSKMIPKINESCERSVFSFLLSYRPFDVNLGSRSSLDGLRGFMIVVAGFFRYKDLVFTLALNKSIFRSLPSSRALHGDIVLLDVRTDATCWRLCVSAGLE